MTIIFDGTNGITSPGGDTSNTSHSTPIVRSPSSLTFQTNGSTTAMTINASQNVGIGTSSPSGFLGNKLVIATGGTANEGITIYSSSNNGSIWFADATTGNGRFAGGIDYQHSTNEMVFYFDNIGNARFISGGTLLTGGKSSATANGGDVQVSKGITFPATQSASSDANTLDDYEEGTWTPNQGTGLTVNGTFASTGRYVKIGRLVYVEGTQLGTTNIAVAAVGMICSNLPFTPTTGTASGMGGLTNNSINQASSCWVNPGGVQLYATEAVTATAQLWWSATYYALN